MGLKFRQLQAFHKVIETGTVSTAAELLGISQPGVSNLLSQLEHYTRLKLYTRHKGRLVPTSEGKVLFQEVDTMVRGLFHVEQCIEDLRNKQAGNLQVASMHSLSFGFIQSEIAKYTQSRPNLTVSYQSQYSKKIQEWIDTGLFEIGICEMPIDKSLFDYEVYPIEMLCALPKGHALENEEELNPSMLSGEAFIVMGPEHIMSRQTRDAFYHAGADWNPTIHTHLFANKLAFVKQNMGVCLIDPLSTNYDQSPDYSTVRFTPKIAMDIAIITSKNRPLSIVGQEFLQQIKATLQPYQT
ncbi:MAG TPA: LysR family transcriptional regulator [Oceanospirillaceae bacterium]|nr:LysR family transcriptional regulator [Oceanospirillaceae bacterium]